MALLHQQIRCRRILLGKFSKPVIRIILKGVYHLVGKGEGRPVTTKRRQPLVVALVLRITRLGDHREAGIMLSKVSHTTQVVDMSLGQHQVAQGRRAEAVKILLDDGRLEAHTRIDLDIALVSLQQIAVRVGFAQYNEVVDTLPAQAHRVGFYRP